MAKITDEAEAKTFIASVKDQNPKANHNCYAYMLGDDDHIQRESDDGEPSGTAGVPILNVLQQEQLHNVVAVTTRYFGGIKLGAGGLIRAYSNATSNAIREIGLVARVKQTEILIEVDYALYDKLAHFISTETINAQEPEFGATVKLRIFVNSDQITSTTTALTNLLAGKLIITVGEDRFQEVPYTKQKD
ncbi:IMPACT family protein [Secundilactobacillus oryzae]